jgi:hypothetical protein
MNKLILFCAVASTMFFAASCERNELLEQELQRPVVPSAQPSVVITGDGASTTRSTGGYVTGAGLYDGDARATVRAVPYSGYKSVSFTGGPVSGNPNQFTGSDLYNFKVQSQD